MAGTICREDGDVEVVADAKALRGEGAADGVAR